MQYRFFQHAELVDMKDLLLMFAFRVFLHCLAFHYTVDIALPDQIYLSLLSLNINDV
jgi:hypothetical protein